MNRNTRYGLVVIALLLIVPSNAMAQDVPQAPVGIPTPNRIVNGYDWEARTHAVHLVRDGFAAVNEIELDEVERPYIDLEITRLAAHAQYTLTGGSGRKIIIADAQGHGIAWTVPAAPDTWILQRFGAPEATSTFIIKSRQLDSLDVFAPQTMDGCAWYAWWCDHSYSPPPPPEPTGSSYLQAMVVEQAAYSFTPDARVSVGSCWDHSVKVSAETSAKFQDSGISAGGDLTGGWKECVSFPSRGAGAEFRRGWSIRKDTYEDGSWKVYPVSTTKYHKVDVVDWVYTPDENAEIWEIGALDDAVVFERGVNHGMAVFYGAAVKVFGTGLDVTVTAQSSWEGTYRVELNPPETGSTTFLVQFANSAGDARGMIPMVWRK